VKRNKVARRLVKVGIKTARVWYRVEKYTNVGLDWRCQLWHGWGHIENICSSKPMCGYCSGHHLTSEHSCKVVG
jgi:hypothetical protein